MCSADCFQWAHPVKKTQGHPSHLLLGQLRSTFLSRRLLRGEFQSYCFKLVSSALLQSCITGLIPRGNRGRDRQAAPRPCTQLGRENWRHLEMLTVSRRVGQKWLQRDRPDLRGASPPGSAVFSWPPRCAQRARQAAWREARWVFTSWPRQPPLEASLYVPGTPRIFITIITSDTAQDKVRCHYQRDQDPTVSRSSYCCSWDHFSSFFFFIFLFQQPGCQNAPWESLLCRNHSSQ